MVLHNWFSKSADKSATSTRKSRMRRTNAKDLHHFCCIKRTPTWSAGNRFNLNNLTLVLRLQNITNHETSSTPDLWNFHIIWSCDSLFIFTVDDTLWSSSIIDNSYSKKFLLYCRLQIHSRPFQNPHSATYHFFLSRYWKQSRELFLENTTSSPSIIPELCSACIAHLHCSPFIYYTCNSCIIHFQGADSCPRTTIILHNLIINWPSNCSL